MTAAGGAWALLVRQYLGQRAKTKAEFVKSEMRDARQATGQAIAALYRVIMAMYELGSPLVRADLPIDLWSLATEGTQELSLILLYETFLRPFGSKRQSRARGSFVVIIC